MWLTSFIVNYAMNPITENQRSVRHFDVRSGERSGISPLTNKMDSANQERIVLPIIMY